MCTSDTSFPIHFATAPVYVLSRLRLFKDDEKRFSKVFICYSVAGERTVNILGGMTFSAILCRFRSRCWRHLASIADASVGIDGTFVIVRQTQGETVSGISTMEIGTTACRCRTSAGREK